MTTGTIASTTASRRPLRVGRGAQGLCLVTLLAIQALVFGAMPRDWHAQTSPGPAPHAATLRAATLGEGSAAAYALTLYLQTFDAQAGLGLPLRSLDQERVGEWIERALDLRPASAYPLLLLSRVFAETAQPDDARRLLDRVERRFREAPDLRWPWLAHAVYVARHVMHDTALARTYARSLRIHATGPGVPSWATQAEILLLADLDDREAARLLLGALIDSGRIGDPAELAFLAERLSALERSGPTDGRHPVPAAPRR